MSDMKTLQKRLDQTLARLDESSPSVQSNRNAIAQLIAILDDLLKSKTE
jgi:cell division protein ZapA (FtsZ GTPase activity inhibitor)